MAEDFRPGPFVPLSRTFATRKTGTAIQKEFGVEGLGVWAAMLAAADRGMIVLRHEHDWDALGIDPAGVHIDLPSFLTFLGHHKQTRKTRQGRTLYVELTRWEDWNKTKTRELARRRKSRSRQQSERDISVTNGVTPAGHKRDKGRDLEKEKEEDKEPKAVRDIQTSREPEPEWAGEDEERPQDFHVPENLLREMA